MIDKGHLIKLALDTNKNYNGFLKEFHKRIWQTDLDIYKIRLQNIGFENFKKILDAGCGFGQWSLCLSENCKYVYSIDSDFTKISDLKYICNQLQIDNIRAIISNIEATNFGDKYFDAIFCYSVLYLTNYRRTLKEFDRILKPGGKLYLSTNGLGWYLHNLIGEINSSMSNTKEMAIDALHNTLDFMSDIPYDNTKQLITVGKNIIHLLEGANFTINYYGGEGTYAVIPNAPNYSFYKSNYFNEEGVYEIIATKN